MSHIIIEIIIKEKIFKIKLKNKINELKDNELTRIYHLILSLKILENQKGNEYDQASIEYKYIKQTLIVEHINIFKIIRSPSRYEFIKYFLSIKEEFDTQGETKINLNEYITSTEEISQNIQIKMVFKIETTIKEIEEKEKKFNNNLIMDGGQEELFKWIRKDMEKNN